MAMVNLTVTVDLKTLMALEELVEKGKFRSKSTAVQYALKKVLELPGEIPKLVGKTSLAELNEERAIKLVKQLAQAGVGCAEGRHGDLENLKTGEQEDPIDYMSISDHQWYHNHKNLVSVAWKKIYGGKK